MPLLPSGNRQAQPFAAKSDAASNRVHASDVHENTVNWLITIGGVVGV